MIISGSAIFGSGGGLGPLRIGSKEKQAIEQLRSAGLSVNDFARQFVDVRGLLGKLRSASKTTRSFKLTNTLSASSQPLGLDTEKTQTSLRSTAEVNALTTSYTGGKKAFSGLSTTTATVAGIYDGDQGTDTLTFTVKKNQSGVVGVSKVQIDVTDGAGKKIQTLNFKANQPPGTAVELRNGLTVSLSAGLALEGDSFTVDVFDNAPQSVDPDVGFDANPGFEPGLSVGAGQFRINGTIIDVAASDSINSVLAKINQADIGVIAKFDKASEKVVLLADSRGPGGTISLGGDSSGFYDAVKLTNATVVQGKESDLDRVIDDVGALSGISTGTFSINGQQLKVDTAVDSMQDVLDRINTNKQAGVFASYDANDDVIRFKPKSSVGALELDDETSGLFTALDLELGLLAGSGVGSVSFVDPSKVRSSLQTLASSLQPLFNGVFGAQADTQSRLATMDLKSAVGEVFSDLFDANASGERFRSGLGVDFVFDDPNGNVVRIDTDKLARALKDKPEEVLDLFFAKSGGSEQGLLYALDKAFDKIGSRLASYVDPTGNSALLLDLEA